MKSLRIAFMGTPEFALPTLSALIEAKHEIAAVYTRPPAPAGRGERERRSPVHDVAAGAGLEVRIPASIRKTTIIDEFCELGLDAAVIVAYGLILPMRILGHPELGCLNLHASLLPRWRGAAPIQRAVMAGDDETGVTIMQMDRGLDTGPILLQERVQVGALTTAGDLHDILAELGAGMMLSALEALYGSGLTSSPQQEEGVTYADRIERSETVTEWDRPAGEVDCHIRGLSPTPGAWTRINGERVRLLRSTVAEGAGMPGVTLDDQMTVACKTGAVQILEVQRPGRSAMSVTEMLRGFDVPQGTRFGDA